MFYAAGGLLIFTGVGHLLLSTRGTFSYWRSIVAAGWFGAVVLEPQGERERDHSLGFWSTAGSFGFPLILIGGLVIWLAADGREPPVWLGWAVLAYGVLTTSVATRGGFWPVGASGLLLLAGAYA